MIKWIKFMFSNGSQSTYFNATETDPAFFQENSGEHGFQSAEEALEKSTSEVFIFWDGKPVGAGKIEA